MVVNYIILCAVSAVTVSSLDPVVYVNRFIYSVKSRYNV